MSSNCKTCNQLISWDLKKREELGTKRPLNASDMTIHHCISSSNGSTTTSTTSSQNNTQVRDQQIEQQSIAATTVTAPIVYPFSVKLEESPSKNGAIIITTHVYGTNLDSVKTEAVKLFLDTKAELVIRGVKVLNEVKEVAKIAADSVTIVGDSK